MHFGVNGNRVLRLAGFGNHLTDHFNEFGRGYLMASVYGVDLAVEASQLSPENFGEDAALIWPEVGIRLNMDTLSGVYSKRQSRLGAGVIECDFNNNPNSFSIVWKPDFFNEMVYDLVVESYAEDSVSASDLRENRRLDSLDFNTCACCRRRGERIRNHTADHPVSVILQGLVGDETTPEFHVSNGCVDMVCAWRIEEVSNWAGEVTCIGKEHILCIDVSMIHTMQVYTMVRKGREFSILRCYHSLGGMMLEMSVAGDKYAVLWHRICSADSSNYSSSGNNTPYVG